MPRLVIVSNRVSLPSNNGSIRAGGLEVALAPITANGTPTLWFGWSGEIVESGNVTTRQIEQHDRLYVVTDLSHADHEEYYNGFANRVLWPVLHYRLDLTEFTRRDLSGYLRVNRHFASELAQFIRADDIVWVNDYHLIPIASELRRQGFTNPIGFFLHVPCPIPEILTVLPNHEQLVPLLLQYDLVGFQTDKDATNFTRYLTSEGFAKNIFQRGGDHIVLGPARRVTRIGSFPVGIDVNEFQSIAAQAIQSPFVQEVASRVAGRSLMIGVDRLDYSKGLVQRLEAFEKFCESHPDLLPKITYLQIAPLSRTEIPEYGRLEEVIATVVARINGKYGDLGRLPIRYLNKTYSRAILAGLYRSARVALVTPLRDGMNLVAKEYVAAQDEQDPGVLVLSRFAGAAIECNHALLVNPYDPEEVAAAIHQALVMPLDERRERHAANAAALRQNQSAEWSTRFLRALNGEIESSLAADGKHAWNAVAAAEAPGSSDHLEITIEPTIPTKCE
jgi:trehalose 6-phosphate synthase